MTATGNKLLIRPAVADPAAATSIDQWLWLSGSGQSTSSHGARPPAAGAATLLIPACWMHIRSLQLPAMSAAKLAQALPYALEDHLAGDVESLHLVSGRQQADGSVLVAAIDPALLQSVLAQLQALDVHVSRALPDASCLPRHPHSHTIMALADSWLLQDAAHQALCLTTAELDWLESVADEAADWHFYGTDQQQPPANIKGKVQRHRIDDPMLTLEQHGAACELNLMRGRFGVVDGNNAKIWRAPALAALVLVLLLTGHALTEQWLLQRELQRQQDQVVQQMHRAFPDINTIVNPRVQAERALAARTGGGR